MVVFWYIPSSNKLSSGKLANANKEEYYQLLIINNNVSSCYILFT